MIANPAETQRGNHDRPLQVIANLPSNAAETLDALLAEKDPHVATFRARKLVDIIPTGDLPNFYSELSQLAVPENLRIDYHNGLARIEAGIARIVVTKGGQYGDEHMKDLSRFLNKLTQDRENGNGHSTQAGNGSSLLHKAAWREGYETHFEHPPEFFGFSDPQEELAGLQAITEENLARVDRNVAARRGAVLKETGFQGKVIDVPYTIVEPQVQPAALPALPAHGALFEEEQSIKKPRERSEQWLAREKDRQRRLAFYRLLRTYTQLDNSGSSSFVADGQTRNDQKDTIAKELAKLDSSLLSDSSAQNVTATETIDAVLKNPTARGSLSNDSLLGEFQRRCTWVHYARYKNHRLSNTQQELVKDIALETLIIDYNPRTALKRAQRQGFVAENNQELLDSYTMATVLQL